MSEETGDAEHQALFVSDQELRRRINPKIGRDRFAALIKAAELRGFPKKKSDWGGRYWPKVVEWLDRDNNLGSPSSFGDAEDGPENFDQRPRTRTRRR